MRRLFERVWTSPTMMSWASFGIRAASVPVLLPLLVTRLDARELTVWLLIPTITSFAAISDLGFGHTFYRLIAFALGGATRDDLLRVKVPSRNVALQREANWDTVEAVFSTMLHVYLALGLLFLVALGTLGTVALMPVINALPDPDSIWLVWPLIVVVGGITFIGSAFVVYLQGVNCIAEVKRLDTFMQIPALLTYAVLLLLNFGLVHLLLAQQFWAILSVVRNYQLCRYVHGGRLRTFRWSRFDRTLFLSALGPAWRTGIGAFASLGSTRLCIIMFSRYALPEVSAMFLLGMTIIDRLVEFSMAPYHTKLPNFSVLAFQGSRERLIAEARRAMLISHLCLVVPGMILAIAGDPLFRLIGSNVPFLPRSVWVSVLIGIVFQRHGAMHIQLYSTSNHIIWHYANGISGAVLVTTFFLLQDRVGIYAIAIAYIVAYGLIYMPICLWYSLRYLRVGFLEFERWNLMIGAGFVASVAALYAALRTGSNGL